MDSRVISSGSGEFMMTSWNFLVISRDVIGFSWIKTGDF